MKATVALFLVAGLAMALVLPVGTARGDDSATEEARQHFQRGRQLFDVGRWDDAAGEFEKAYALRNDPVFLYNMAQSYRRKGDAKRALDLYKNYLIKAPKSPQRAEVEERIEALQKQIEAAGPEVKPPVRNATTSGAASPGAAPPATMPARVPPPVYAPSTAPVTAAPADYSSPSAAAAPVAAPATTSPPAAAAAAPSPATMASPAPATGPAPYAPPTEAWPATPAPATGPAAYPPSAAVPAPGPYPAPAYGSAVAYPYPSGAAPGAPQTQPGIVQATATPTPAATSPGRGLRVAGIVCGSVGVGAIGAGIFFGAEASAYSHSVETGKIFNPNFDSRGKLYETLQWVGYGVGAGLVATGAALYGIGAVSARSQEVALVPAVFPGGAGLSAQGGF